MGWTFRLTFLEEVTHARQRGITIIQNRKQLAPKKDARYSVLARDTQSQADFLHLLIGTTGKARENQNMGKDGRIQNTAALQPKEGDGRENPIRVVGANSETMLGTPDRAIQVVIQSNSDVNSKSYKDSVNGGLPKENEFKAMKPLSTPRREGGNVIIDLDVKEYR